MKIQYQIVNDLIMNYVDGDWQYEKLSGSYPVASMLGSSYLKYCLKHSIAHRMVLNVFYTGLNSDEYNLYLKVKELIETMINYLVIRDGNFYGIRLIVEYGNSFITAQSYRDLPEFPRNVDFNWYMETYETVLNLVDSIESLKHKEFTWKAKTA